MQEQNTKSCRQCGVEKSVTDFYARAGADGLWSRCKSCISQYRKQWRLDNSDIESQRKRAEYARNKERYTAHNRAFYAANTERQKEYQRAYTLLHRDACAARSKRYNSDHAESISAQKRLHYQLTKDVINARRRENREQVRIKENEYRRLHPEIIRQKNSRGYARRSGITGSHSRKEWDALCARFDNRCVRCGNRGKLTKDHVIPVSESGSTDYISNIQPLCLSCNASKSNGQATDYRRTPFIRRGQSVLFL